MPHVITATGETVSSSGFVIGEVQYPGNVLELWTSEELSEIGVEWQEPSAIEPVEVITESLLKETALKALRGSDAVALRCFKTHSAYPASWVAYDEALREIVRTGEGELPEQPDYPENGD